jgi:hypothetical protein
VKHSVALILGSAALALAACTAATGDDLGSQEQNATPIDRLLIGKAAQYPADLEMRTKTALFQGSMAARRKMAWEVIERTVAPVAISATARAPQAPSGPELDAANAVATNLTLPRFQTWHAREEILPMFDRLFRGLEETNRAKRAPFSAQSIQDVFPWNVTRATSLASFTQERLNQRKAELASPEGVASLGKDPRVLMSPDYVQHLFESYSKVVNCKPSDPVDPTTGTPLVDPATSEAFAPCLAGEFPAGAVAVKSRWMPSSSPVPVYDTSAKKLRARLEENAAFPESGDSEADPDATQAYTMQVTPDMQSRLVAFHIMTKELRDWVWITVWWSKAPDTDFGADRPASLKGPWANYKMCVVTAYDEKDKAPGTGFPKTLANALDSANEAGPATWCSNPYLETFDHGAKTNCIGCHQHGGTRETSQTLIANGDLFPDNTRKRVRKDFPSDYIFTTEGGLELASEMRNRIEAISPTPAATTR